MLEASPTPGREVPEKQIAIVREGVFGAAISGDETGFGLDDGPRVALELLPVDGAGVGAGVLAMTEDAHGSWDDRTSWVPPPSQEYQEAHGWYDGKPPPGSNRDARSHHSTDAPKPGRILTGADFIARHVPPVWLIDGIVQRSRLYACTSLTGHGKTGHSPCCCRALRLASSCAALASPSLANVSI